MRLCEALPILWNPGHHVLERILRLGLLYLLIVFDGLGIFDLFEYFAICKGHVVVKHFYVLCPQCCYKLCIFPKHLSVACPGSALIYCLLFQCKFMWFLIFFSTMTYFSLFYSHKLNPPLSKEFNK